MRIKHIFLTVIAVIFPQPVFGNNASKQLAFTQLKSLNHFWEDQDLFNPVLDQEIEVMSEVELIQMHLSLVEEKLRSTDTDHLSVNQRKNRLAALDILHTYWKNGVFPQNL